MNYLYLILDIGTISIPLLYSVFEKEFYFWQYAKPAFLSIFIIAFPFLIWDAFFTKIGVWGFNGTYHLPYKIFGMPIEEILFFICVPYACLFTYEGFKRYYPKFKISEKSVIFIGSIVLCIVLCLLLLNFGKWYTTINFIWFVILISYALVKCRKDLQSYFPVFLIILVPFFIVNGVLTGTGIESEVVWYNNKENLGFRLGTIPIEDIFYAFNLLFSIQLVFGVLKQKKRYE